MAWRTTRKRGERFKAPQNTKFHVIEFVRNFTPGLVFLGLRFGVFGALRFCAASA